MNWPRVSIIVVSRGRPDDLHRCLTGLSQIDYPDCEVIVVADAASREGVGLFHRKIKLVPFEIANISAARNAGLAHAAGEIVSFIDDDAVPEPAWLKNLIFAMLDTELAASGGYVIGRNGFSLQWGARQVMPDGTAEPIELDAIPDGAVIKTEGTNMAVRREVLDALGFDEAFAFYLDETDLNIRLAKHGHRTAIAPLAVVHHGFAASAHRSARRVPRDLWQIAASTAVFQRKHGTPDPKPERARQRARLLRHMVAGDLMPGDVLRLLRGFDKGWAEGMARAPDQRTTFDVQTEFKPFPTETKGDIILKARFWRAKAARHKARNLVASGQRVTLYLFSLTPLRHRFGMSADGVWEQRGGQFGASQRSDPWFKWWTSGRRTTREQQLRKKSWEFGQIDP